MSDLACWSAAVVGLATTCIAGSLTVSPLLAILRSRIVIPRISQNDQVEHLWRSLISHPNEPGKWVGFIERVVFFGAIYLASWQVAAAWLGFKLAAKWEAWSNMGRIADSVEGVDSLMFAYGRRIWAAQGYATLVVGTSANFFIAAVGVLIAKYGTVLICQQACTSPF